MRLLMVSGDRNVAVGEKGPFHAMQREFSRHFDRIDVLCPRPDRAVVCSTIHDHVHFHPAPVGRHRMVGWIAEEGARLLAAHGHTLITSHDYGWFYNGLGSARLSRRSGTPYVSEIHHVPGHPVPADRREVLDRFIAKRYVRWARSRACAFRVVNSVEMPALLRSWGVADEQIAVLGSQYMDLETFSPPPAPLAAERDLVFVGRMVNNKGLERIVDAVAALKARGTPVTGLLLGRGPLRAAARERARQKGVGGELEFVEWVDSPADLADLYRRSRVCVCASTCEGGPRFTLEAMACGTPCVSTRVGIMGELLDGENGRLCDFTADSLADELANVLQDESRRAAMGRRAHETASRFEYATMIRGYAEGLQALAARHARGAA